MVSPTLAQRAATTSDPLTVGASVTGSEVTLTPLRGGTVTVTATDPGRLSASQTFTATVGAGNRPSNAVGSSWTRFAVKMHLGRNTSHRDGATGEGTPTSGQFSRWGPAPLHGAQRKACTTQASG